MSDWKAKFAHLATVSDDEWSNEFDKLREVWQEEYKREFCVIALALPRWDKEIAEDCARETANDAFSHAMSFDASPAEIAQKYVIDFEKEWSDSEYN